MRRRSERKPVEAEDNPEKAMGAREGPGEAGEEARRREGGPRRGGGGPRGVPWRLERGLDGREGSLEEGLTSHQISHHLIYGMERNRFQIP